KHALDPKEGAGNEVFHNRNANVVDFPYRVEAGGVRWWAAFSQFVDDAVLDGQSGAMFHPSPLPGDGYRVVAYLDLHATTDTDAQEPTGAEGHAMVGDFRVWRKITIARLVRKTRGRAMLPDLAAIYEDAYILV